MKRQTKTKPSGYQKSIETRTPQPATEPPATMKFYSGDKLVREVPIETPITDPAAAFPGYTPERVKLLTRSQSIAGADRLGSVFVLRDQSRIRIRLGLVLDSDQYGFKTLYRIGTGFQF